MYMPEKKRYFAILAVQVEITAADLADAREQAEAMAAERDLTTWSVWSTRQLPPEEVPPLSVE